jgi:O-antigen/teichoic acid export membrane protein
MSLERQAITGVKWSVVAKVVTQLVAWAVTLLVIRLLNPADYGLMALNAVVLSIFSGVAELGLGASLIQARNPTQHDLARVAGALLVLNLGCAAIVCLGAPLFATAFGSPRLELIIQISSVQFLLSAIAAIPEALAYRDMRFRWLAAADIASGLTTSATTLVLALSNAGVWALILGNLGGYTVRTVILLFGGTIVRPTFVLRGIGQFLRFGGAWSGARLAWQLTSQADVLIAGRALSQEAVGAYSVAVQLANLPLQKAMGIVNQVAFPAMARLQAELPRMRRRMLTSIRLLGFGAIPILWGFGAVAPEFVELVLGDQWAGVILPLQLIAIVAPLRMLATLLATAVSAIGRADVELVNTLMSLAVFVVAFLVGVRWNLNGLAIAYVIATSLSLVLNFPRTARVVGISARQIGMAGRSTVISGGAMLVATAAARFGLTGASGWLRLSVLVVIGAATYFATMLLIDRTIWADARKIIAVWREQS